MSVASYWEVIVKIKNGQLTISADPASWWLRATRDLRGTVLAIRAGHVAAVHKLQDHHKDPFDRILIAQAMVEGIGLVTSDEAIQMYPVKTIW